MGFNYAKEAIDIALWGIIGKHYNTPLCELLGIAEGDKLPSCYTISIEVPEKLRAWLWQNKSKAMKGCK